MVACSLVRIAALLHVIEIPFLVGGDSDWNSGTLGLNDGDVFFLHTDGSTFILHVVVFSCSWQPRHGQVFNGIVGGCAYPEIDEPPQELGQAIRARLEQTCAASQVALGFLLGKHS